MRELAVITLDTSKRDVLAESAFLEAFNAGPGMLLRAYAWAINKFVVEQLGGKPQIGLEDETALAAYYNHLTDSDLLETIRIRKTNGGYTIFMPVGEQKIIPLLYDLYDHPSIYQRDPEEIFKGLERAIPHVWDLDKSVDQNLGNLSKGLTEAMEVIPDVGSEVAEPVEKGIIGFRLVSPPAMKAFQSLTSPAEQEVFFNKEFTTKGQHINMLIKAWNCRSWSMYAEYFMPEEMAEHITQEQGDSIFNYQLADYVSRLHADTFTRGRGSTYSSHIVAVSRVAEENKKSDIIATPKTNEFDLAVTEKGIVTWIPKADIDPAFVETALEEGGQQPDGDWTARDTVDPENNEYVTDTARDGRQVRKLKPRGRNMLMYVDWHNGKLAYTTSEARIRIRDISMFRAATAYQLLNYLKIDFGQEGTNETQSKTVRHINNALNMAVEYGMRNGIEFMKSKEKYKDAYSSDQDLQTAQTYFNSRSIVQVLNLAIRLAGIAQRTRRTAYGHDENRDLTPAEYQAVDAFINNMKSGGATIGLISKNSPIGILRALYDYYEEVVKSIESNPDSAFGGTISVVNMLDTIGALKVLVHYGSKVAEVEEQDKADRKAYLDPDLDPIDEITLPPIPYVSGSVELMPHQVKAWNYLKNAPYNAVLSVGAGGGKTLLGLLYAAFLLGNKDVKRPLIVCPGNLVSNYINDAVWVFEGRMNIVNVSSDALASKQWGEEKLLELCKGAPVNTLFITDYDFIVPKGNSTRLVSFVYGNVPVKISLNTEFMKKIPWDLCIMDESHLLKTRNSGRNREIMRLISGIKYKVQMSGTYVSDTLFDLVGEYAIMNPQAFGDETQFAEEFFTDGKKSAPIPDAQKMMRDRISETCQFIHIDRKEWAALLPRRHDAFYPVEMTEAQQLVYMAILKETKEEIEKQLKDNPILRNAFAGKTEENETDDGGDDDSLDDMLDGPLNFYLARLEGFLTAPASDPLGKHLSGKDAESPKLAKVIELIRHHEQAKIPGKIIIWTQYVESAASLFEHMPNDLKRHSLHYTAGNGDQILLEFEKNPDKRYMFGCEKSINTGHNLQVASRIIRTEFVWNYGTLEQGESRINRPKTDDPRKEENGGKGIYYDWIFTNKAIDVTKMSRLFSKLVTTVQFYNADNPEYMSIDVPAPIRLSKKNIFSVNDWRDEEKGCRNFFKAYERYQQVQEREYQAFRESPDARKEGYTLPKGKILPKSGLLKNIPYTPKMNLYGASELGLVPFLEYVALHKEKGVPLWDIPDWSPQGLNIHCEYGDGEAVDYNRRGTGKPASLRIVTPDGGRASVPLTACWVITRKISSSMDVREALAKKIGIKSAEVVIPTETVEEDQRPAPKDVGRGNSNQPGKTGRLPEKDAKGHDQGFEVFVSSYDNRPAIAVDAKNPNVAEISEDLQTEFGFKIAPAYYYAHIKTAKALRSWLKAIQTKFKIVPVYLELLEEDLALWEEHKDIQKFLLAMNMGQRPNFFRDQIKPAATGTLKPYLYIDNGNAVFLCLNAKAHTASISKVKAVKVPTITWGGPVQSEMISFGKNKQDLQSTLKKLFGKYHILNKKEAVADFNKMRINNTLPKP